MWLNPVTGGIFNQILSQFTASEDVAFAKIVKYIQTLDPNSAIAADVANSVYEILKTSYNVMLTSDQFKEIILNQTEGAYKAIAKADPDFARTDFGLPDTRAITFLENSDTLYLGRFVASADLKTRITDYIREAYLKNGRAIGDSSKELNAFMKVFGEELDASKSDVRMIIDTTVSRARVFGQVNGMRAAGGQTYEITGPLDSLTCSICQDMVGRSFTVAGAVSQVDQILQAGPEGLDSSAPFLKGALSVGDLKGMDDEELEAAGFTVPPYHPHCRHRLAISTFYEDTADIPYAVE
jgi:hypothetical protein